MFRYIKAHIHASSSSKSQQRRWVWQAKAIAACALTVGAIHAPTALAAGSQSCASSPIQPESVWNIKTDFAGIANGVTVADITFSNTVTASNTMLGYTMGVVVFSPTASGPYQTFPLKTFPGLSMRWRWDGYVNIQDAAVNISSLAPSGTVVTQTGLITSAPFTTNIFAKKYKLRWKLELVVTDVKAYAGGKGNFYNENVTSQMQIMPTISDITAPISNQTCNPVTSDFSQALSQGGSIELPELPKPPTPTCQFPLSTMNQSIALNFSTTGRVPSNGADRTQGAGSESRFNINAINCGLNTNYAIYFTDTNASAATKDYLNSSNPAMAGKVNLRIYQGSSNTPIQFGPAPTGSTLPANPPGVTNANTPAGSNFLHDFYVQYVRAPGVTGTLTSGELAAKTTVTVVYP